MVILCFCSIRKDITYKSESESVDNEEEEDDDEMDNDDENECTDNSSSKQTSISLEISRSLCNRFFKRSDSTLALGHEPTDPFTTPLKEALPLADRPHLLNPTARRDHLFGTKKETTVNSSPSLHISKQPLLSQTGTTQ